MRRPARLHAARPHLFSRCARALALLLVSDMAPEEPRELTLFGIA